MKHLMIVVVGLILGISAQAQNKGAQNSSKKGVVLTLPQFSQSLSSYFESQGSNQPAAFQGELDEIGGECAVQIIQEADQLQVTLTGENGLKLGFKVTSDEPIRYRTKGADDDSFMKEYRVGFYGSSILTIVHADDAYDTVSVQVGSTSLTCGAYY